MQNFMNKVQAKAVTAAYSAKSGLDRAKTAVSNRSGQGALDTAIFPVEDVHDTN